MPAHSPDASLVVLKAGEVGLDVGANRPGAGPGATPRLRAQTLEAPALVLLQDLLEAADDVPTGLRAVGVPETVVVVVAVALQTMGGGRDFLGGGSNFGSRKLGPNK